MNAIKHTWKVSKHADIIGFFICKNGEKIVRKSKTLLWS